jgi:hypothetical protein
VDLFGWSLQEIDETNMESLLPFIFHYPKWKRNKSEIAPGLANTTYCDEVNWL